MKKFLKIDIVIVILSILIPTVTVSAKEIEEEITNNMGVVMTQEDYDYIKNTLGEAFANNADEEFITGALNNEVTKLEPEDKSTLYSSYTPIDGFRYSISVFSHDNAGKYVFLISSTWTKMPSTKSYDVLGFRWSNDRK